MARQLRMIRTVINWPHMHISIFIYRGFQTLSRAHVDLDALAIGSSQIQRQPNLLGFDSPSDMNE